MCKKITLRALRLILVTAARLEWLNGGESVKFKELSSAFTNANLWVKGQPRNLLNFL